MWKSKAQEDTMLSVDIVAEHLVACLELMGFGTVFECSMVVLMQRTDHPNWALIKNPSPASVSLEMGTHYGIDPGFLAQTRRGRTFFAGNHETAIDMIRWLSLSEWMVECNSRISDALLHYRTDQWCPYPMEVDFSSMPEFPTLEEYKAIKYSGKEDELPF
jgi:hypothetical protein